MMALTARDVCLLAPVIPVLVVEDARTAVPLGRALVAGGLPALEVTLRTPAALDAIRALAAVDGAVVGAGTLRNRRDVEGAAAAGARFGVSPGFTHEVAEAAEELGLPLLPGVATASEAMSAAERGFAVLKLFPAEAVGGAALLKAFASPLAGLFFCPTGGVSVSNAPSYLALPNVLCVGGSWVAPPDAVAAADWQRVARLAGSAARLSRATDAASGHKA